ncbi:LacI family DNA-binding transcriptional regulator [Prevotella amnii]|uniref:LacI family DNA-binding transcriptional regulator n=1 Tax=Prevotella amnii TaxID=419005 RepID=UPI000372F0CE|nr:LacI family DNA-binding transcriptional regulator [Prevotella amnii]
MTKQAKVTMKDIAKNLGVSVATVSRALKNNPRISTEKREMIKQYAYEHNFTPNILAENLRKNKLKTMRVIGVILPQCTHYYFSSILSGIEEVSFQRGYLLIVAQSNEDFDREVSICQSFIKTQVCGVIVSQSKHTTNANHFKQLLANDIPLVFFDRISTSIKASMVVVDDYMGTFTAVTHLINTGCKRIAFYGTTVDLEIGKNRYNGYHDALRKHGLSIDKAYIKRCDNREDAEAITPSLLNLPSPPDAFFAVNDDTAIGILYVCKHLGYKIPEDISICGFTNGQRAIACDPMLTTVEQRGVKVGEEAANILIDKVEGIIPKDRVEKRIIRTRLILRGTTKRLNDSITNK